MLTKSFEQMPKYGGNSEGFISRWDGTEYTFIVAAVNGQMNCEALVHL